MSQMSNSIHINLDYLEYLKLLNISIVHREEPCKISFEKNGLCITDKGDVQYKASFTGFSIDPSSNTNINPNKCSTIDGYYEANYRFKVTEFNSLPVEALQDSNNNHHQILENIKSIKCQSCLNELTLKDDGEKEFKVLQMPEHDLEELQDNFWCHKHSHGHEEHQHDEGEHQHSHDDLTSDNYKHKKSILYNNSVILVNSNHINLSLISYSNEIDINCSNCDYNIGYKNRKDNIYLWKSNILINDKLQFDLFQLMKLGRYIIECKNNLSKKKEIIFIHLLANDLHYEHSTLKANNEQEISFKKRSKRLLYKLYDNERDLELRNKWFNDVNVDFLSISYDYYIKLLKKLEASTDKLPISYRITKNLFNIAII